MSKKPVAIEESWPAAQVEMWPLERIKPYPQNPRLHIHSEHLKLLKHRQELNGMKPFFRGSSKCAY